MRWWGRRVRRGYLWQGGAEISQYRAEHAGGEEVRNTHLLLLLLLQLLLLLLPSPSLTYPLPWTT